MRRLNLRRLCALCAILMVFVSPVALGEAESAEGEELTPIEQTAPESKLPVTPSRMPGRGGRGMDLGLGVEPKRTDAQQQAISAAQAAYDAAEDEVLDEMAAAGALNPEVVDGYKAQRDARRVVADMDYSNWTIDQLAALRQAVMGGGINDTVLAGLVSQGAITEAEAEIFSLAYAEGVNIWEQVDTSKATQGMYTKLKQAQEAYAQALTDAGIMTGRGAGKLGGRIPR